MAGSHGLNRIVVRESSRVEAGFAGLEGYAGVPAKLRADYAFAVIVGSGGPDLWRGFLNWRKDEARDEAAPKPDPLDRYTVYLAEQLTAPLRVADPGLVAAFPFRHSKQVRPFLSLLQGSVQARATPFGLSFDRQYGPWLGWRLVLLTTLDLSSQLTEAPAQGTGEIACDSCEGRPDTPCVRACPAGAVNVSGFDWEACTRFRLEQTACRDSCAARLACPVGREHRYPPDEMAHHYGASLREIERYYSGNSRSDSE